MARAKSSRLKVTLSEEHAGKLHRLAGWTRVKPGALAGALLAQAIDDADPDAGQIVELLDQVPGAWDRIDAGIADARAGRTVPFDDV